MRSPRTPKPAAAADMRNRLLASRRVIVRTTSSFCCGRSGRSAYSRASLTECCGDTRAIRSSSAGRLGVSAYGCSFALECRVAHSTTASTARLSLRAGSHALPEENAGRGPGGWRLVLPAALGVIAIVWLAVSLATVWRFTVDDAYITLRYSRNVAEGVGPTFNATGPRAEGYTTFLWMMILSIPHVVGVDAVVVAKLLGVAATFATLLVSARWAWNEAGTDRPIAPDASRDARFWAAATAMACLCAVPATAVHAVSGMETALFTLLLTGLLAQAGDHGAREPEAPAAVGRTGDPAGPHAAGGQSGGAGDPGDDRGARPAAQRRQLARDAILVWILPLALYEAWRRAYYGLAFPLPFYVKLASPGRFPGWPDVRSWFASPPLHFVLLLLPAIVRPPRSLWPALATTAALAAFFVLPQHQMGYDHRYLAPLDPTVGVLAGVGLGRLFTRMGMGAPRTRRERGDGCRRPLDGLRDSECTHDSPWRGKLRGRSRARARGVGTRPLRARATGCAAGHLGRRGGAVPLSMVDLGSGGLE